MANHSVLTGSDLHEPKGIENATADQVYVSDGAGSGAWTVAEFNPPNIDNADAGDVFTKSLGGGGVWGPILPNLDIIALPSVEDKETTNQTPAGTDTPLQISFGSGVGTSADPVYTDVDGSIYFTEPGLYNLEIYLNVGRSAAANTSELIIHSELDGTAEEAFSVFITDADSTIPVNFTILKDFPALSTTKVLKLYLTRDSAGDNSGELVAYTTTSASVPDVPSAKVKINKFEIDR